MFALGALMNGREINLNDNHSVDRSYSYNGRETSAVNTDNTNIKDSWSCGSVLYSIIYQTAYVRVILSKYDLSMIANMCAQLQLI